MSNLPHLCQMWQARAKLEHVDEDAQEPNVRISAPSLTSFNHPISCNTLNSTLRWTNQFAQVCLKSCQVMLKRLIGMRKLLLVVLGKEILLKLNLKVMQMWLIKLRNLFLYQLYCYVFIYFLVI